MFHLWIPCTRIKYIWTIYRAVVDIFIFAGIFQKVAEMSLKKVVDRGYIFIFFIFIVFLLTNIFNFFKKSLKFQMFKFLSLIFVRFSKSHWKSRWFSKNFCRNFPTFRRSTTSLILTYPVRSIPNNHDIHVEFCAPTQVIFCEVYIYGHLETSVARNVYVEEFRNYSIDDQQW